MKKISAEDIGKAFVYWKQGFKPGGTDDLMAPFLVDQIRPFTSDQRGWLERARKGLFLSSETIASRLKVARTAYSKYEENEKRGAITLATLAKAAEAMDCELVYAIRPKSKKYFSSIIWEKLVPQSILHPWINNCDQRKRAEALAFIANGYMNSPKFRRKQTWSQRANR